MLDRWATEQGDTAIMPPRRPLIQYLQLLQQQEQRRLQRRRRQHRGVSRRIMDKGGILTGLAVRWAWVAWVAWARAAWFGELRVLQCFHEWSRKVHPHPILVILLVTAIVMTMTMTLCMVTIAVAMASEPLHAWVTEKAEKAGRASGGMLRTG